MRSSNDDFGIHNERSWRFPMTFFLYLRPLETRTSIPLLKRLYYVLLLLILSVSYLQASDMSEEYDAMMEIFLDSEDPSYTTSKKMAEEILAKAKKANDPFYLSKTYYLLAYICANTDEYGNAVIYYLEGARHAEESDLESLKPDLISMYKNLANIMRDYNHYELAHKFADQGIATATDIGNNKQIQALLHNKTSFLLNDGRHHESIALANELLSQKDLPEAFRLELLNKRGVSLKSLERYEEALASYDEIINSDPSPNYKSYISALHNSAYIYREIYDDIPTALRLLEKSKSTIDSAFQNNRKRILCHQNFALTYMAVNSNDLAEHHFKQAINIIEEGNLPPDYYEIYKQLAEFYFQNQRIEEALTYERQYTRELERFIAEQREIEELDKKYNIQLLTERYFDVLAANNERKQSERFARFGISGTAFFFMSILLSFWYRQYRTRQKIKKELSEIDLFSEV